VIVGGEFIACCRTPGNAVRALNMAVRKATVEALTGEPEGYAAMVRQLEAEGLTTSDAQGSADAHFRTVRA